MKIYTRSGDKGQTLVYVNDSIKVSKQDAIIEVYGTLDELNSSIGLLASMLNESEISSEVANLQSIQQHLFEVGYGLSASSRLEACHIEWLEQDIDKRTQRLAPQTSFILPGGHVHAAQAQVCRTLCRRAERVLVSLNSQEPVSDIALAYINRLSDWLFVFSRDINRHYKIKEPEVRS